MSEQEHERLLRDVRGILAAVRNVTPSHIILACGVNRDTAIELLREVGAVESGGVWSLPS